jgi:glycosyltransferase involved in cell wall biosynthesis
MKVLMLDPLDGNPYGPDLASALWDHGIDVRLLVPIGFRNQERTKCPYEEVSPRGGRGRYVRKLLDEIGYIQRVWRLASEWRPDVIHVQWLRVDLELFLLRRLRALGSRVVITAHNAIPHVRRRGDLGFQRRYYMNADRVIAHEPSARDDLVSVLQIPHSKIEIVPHGIPEDAPPASDRKTARKRLGIDEDATTFLCFGGLRPDKGHEMLLEAFHAAALAGGRGQLVFGGWGRREAVRALRSRVQGLGSSANRIHLHLNEEEPMPQAAVEDLFAACDCVVLPYRSISHSGVLFQAFHHERAVLASAVGGFRHVVENGFNGRLIEPDDETEWARSLAELAGAPDLLHLWGRQGRRRAVEMYGHRRVAMQTKRVYETAIGNGGHG